MGGLQCGTPNGAVWKVGRGFLTLKRASAPDVSSLSRVSSERPSYHFNLTAPDATATIGCALFNSLTVGPMERDGELAVVKCVRVRGHRGGELRGFRSQ